ncbi:hypothetical protein [Roseisolibacter sp. H3M3-2]|uniref:hypothetical protein n=1 Tax=Roseisolibacter sp. H3M3-2 TaxID=3031323 RepID=UPI0023DA55D4|nr:hypothetical protein [Roseisolibacter sp. H3M3-2]MDF1503628.1 hypothetical protein [Roseisolibacter sp. H3M3-2]
MKGGKGGRPRRAAGGAPARKEPGPRGKPPKKGGASRPAAGPPKKGARKKPDVGGSSSAGEE